MVDILNACVQNDSVFTHLLLTCLGIGAFVAYVFAYCTSYVGVSDPIRMCIEVFTRIIRFICVYIAHGPNSSSAYPQFFLRHIRMDRGPFQLNSSFVKGVLFSAMNESNKYLPVSTDFVILRQCKDQQYGQGLNDIYHLDCYLFTYLSHVIHSNSYLL